MEEKQNDPEELLKKSCCSLWSAYFKLLGNFFYFAAITYGFTFILIVCLFMWFAPESRPAMFKYAFIFDTVLLILLVFRVAKSSNNKED